MEDTIAAISTALGTGGIGIIRMSGSECFKILDKIFVPKNRNKKIKGYTIKYGNIVENDTVIDEALVSYFVGPHSYTRENMCEINTHGGVVVVKKILDLCLRNGAELAEPGEFTKRAFLNGRIDLSQAEAVMDLINSKTELEAKESASQLKGKLSAEISRVEEKLYDILTAIEVSIDYPEYDIEEIKDKNFLQDLSQINVMLDKMINSFENGKLLKEGVKTVILGRPNAGKSSLMNVILDEDRAIVSSIEGTTRDTIEEFVNIQGIELKLVDTAGIRETDDEIERIGVKRAKSLAENADLIIGIFDISVPFNQEDEEIISLLKNRNSIIVLNKIDITDTNIEVEKRVEKIGKPIIKISTKKNLGIDMLYDEIIKMFDLGKIEANNELIITNERHKDLILKAKENIENSIAAFKNDTPVDMCSIYIKQALSSLGEIMGQDISEEIINMIFKKFCLGK